MHERCRHLQRFRVRVHLALRNVSAVQGVDALEELLQARLTFDPLRRLASTQRARHQARFQLFVIIRRHRSKRKRGRDERTLHQPLVRRSQVRAPNAQRHRVERVS